MLEKSPIRVRTRILLVASAVCVALVLSTDSFLPDPRAVIFIPLFPTGLPAFFIASPASGGHATDAVMKGAVVAAYFIYIIIIGLSLSLPRRKYFYAVFTILLLLLVLNVIGCHQDRKGKAGSVFGQAAADEVPFEVGGRSEKDTII